MTDDTTEILQHICRGDPDALDQLASRVYPELRAAAQAYMRNERTDHSLQPSDLINEAFLRLIDQQRVQWQGRAHFCAVASRMMRRILVDHARKRAAAKRGDGAQRLEFDDYLVLHAENRQLPLLPVDEALTELGEVCPRHAQIVEMRFFGGLTIEETAHALGVSLTTVKADWRVARAWLMNRLTQD